MSPLEQALSLALDLTYRALEQDEAGQLPPLHDDDTDDHNNPDID